MKRVLVFGTFDELHPGHLNFFRQAKALGDELVVVVARDRTVERVKGRRPTEDERVRRRRVQAVEEVQAAVLGDKKDYLKVIKDTSPDIIALGYDQKFMVSDLGKYLTERGLNMIRVVRLKPFLENKYKTSLRRKDKK